VSDLEPPGRGWGEIAVRTADDYLAGGAGTLDESVTVVNLCRSYQYLSKGYYVSLLAEARHQRVLPSLQAIQAANDPFVYFRAFEDVGIDTIDYEIVRGGRRLLPRVIVPGRDATQEAGATPPALEEHEAGPGVPRYERSNARSYREVTSVLGRTVEGDFRRACSAVFRVLPMPLLRIRMYRDDEDEGWEVGQVYPIATNQLTPAETDVMLRELEGDRLVRRRRQPSVERPFRIACLWDPRDPYAPSDEDTLERFERAAAKQRVVFEVIEREDLDLLAQYDALFIRTVTAIDNYTFTFAKTAESLDIPVIDDPQSIIRCSNKVFLHELFEKNAIPMPRSVTLSRRTALTDATQLGFPLIVKLPDGTFSHAVKKVGDPAELTRITDEMFKRSPLLIAQEFTPTPFDWRIGVLEGRLLFAAKYHMAKNHWQIVGRSKSGRMRYGRVEAVEIAAVPEVVRKIAIEATALIGDGLYGVDIKETPSGPVVIEVNDNPNIIAGDEDTVERDRLYGEIIASLLRRIRTNDTATPQT